MRIWISPAAKGAAFPDRNRFMAYAARVMRGLIIDYARSRQAQKRGGQFEITSIRTDVAEAIPDVADLGPLSDALDELATVDARLARIVDLKFFCGFSFARDRRDVGRVGADGAARLGKGAHLSAPRAAGSDSGVLMSSFVGRFPIVLIGEREMRAMDSGRWLRASGHLDRVSRSAARGPR